MKILFILILYYINIATCSRELKSTLFFIDAKENLTAKSEKPALRYGFHRTEECKRFDKAYLCIQKCIDLNYDVAHADRECRCTCYVKQERAKYKPVSPATKTRWRSGAPKTSIPYWANPNKENKTKDQGSESNEALAGDDTGTEKNQGDMTGGTDSTNQEGGAAGAGVTGATNADGSAGTGATDSTNAGQGGTGEAGATGGGATGGEVTGGKVTGEGATGVGATGEGATGKGSAGGEATTVAETPAK